MAKKRNGPKHNQNGNGKGGGKNFKTTAAAVVGGAGGALVGGLLVRSGVDVKTAAIGMTAAGAMGAIALSGPAKAAAYGAAAAGAGQLALGWLATRAAKQEQEVAQANTNVPAQGAASVAPPAQPPKRQTRDGYDARRAFEAAADAEYDDGMDEAA